MRAIATTQKKKLLRQIKKSKSCYTIIIYIRSQDEIERVRKLVRQLRRVLAVEVGVLVAERGEDLTAGAELGEERAARARLVDRGQGLVAGRAQHELSVAARAVLAVALAGGALAAVAGRLERRRGQRALALVAAGDERDRVAGAADRLVDLERRLERRRVGGRRPASAVDRRGRLQAAAAVARGGAAGARRLDEGAGRGGDVGDERLVDLCGCGAGCVYVCGSGVLVMRLPGAK